MRNFLSTDLTFQKSHFAHDRFVQRSAAIKEAVQTIFLIESLSFQQNEKNKILDDHFLIIIIKNDMTKILLNLFIS
jgi:hypothetical protein